MWKKIEPMTDQDAYNSTLKLTGDGMLALRELFPDAKADQHNFVLFSTSGIHGTYQLIEDAETNLVESSEELIDITFLIIQPRIVCTRFGNATPKTTDDIAFLKALRASSLSAISQIGTP